jgi:drug/metabolite transporter (DMT)-like permease
MLPLFIRMSQNSLSLLITYYAIRYFDLTTVAMVSNLSPMVTVVLAYFMLGERLTIKELVILFAAFGSVTLLIMGGDEVS